MNQYGTSYKRWTLFFPKALREKVYIVYAFVRAADQIVDTPGVNKQQAREDLNAMQKTTLEVWQWKKTQDPLIRAYVVLAKQYNFERERIEAFFEAMRMDTHLDRYATYEQLQTYMYGSAEVIWLMMTQLIGYQSDTKTVLSYARKLGEAMQYTNFLRDVREDRVDHGRIYMPLEKLAAFDLTHEDIITFAEQWKADDRWYAFCRAEISFTQQLYSESKLWIALLDKQWRFAVYLASMLYAGILRKIEQGGYDQFANDCHTTKREKFRLFLWAVFTYYKK
jgi:15-cis-phytoene synthase